MKKVFLISFLVVLTLFTVDFAMCKDNSAGLISVKPAYSQPSNTPQNSEPASGVQAQYGDPAPRDQLYVFWLVGKLISYPIDKVESYVLRKLHPAEQPKAVPASAPATGPNPFDSINRREIPPAPPVEGKIVRGR